MGDTAPQLRIGDVERRAVDDRLMRAVGDGQLTLTEYDERAVALWQARTRTELEALVADLPASTPAAAPAAAGPAWSAPQRVVAVTPEDRSAPSRAVDRSAADVPSRRGALARAGSRLAGLAVPLAVLAGVVVAGPDGAAVFGSPVQQVAPGTEQVRVSTLFGSVTVVVPDGARVDSSGVVVFGSMDCDAACSGVVPGSDQTGLVVRVRGVGGFGSVEVLTQSEHAAERRADRDDDD